MRHASLLIVSLFLIPPATNAADPVPRPPTPQELELVEKHVRPVLADNCLGCHGPKKQMGGLRLDTRQRMLAGGESGPAIVPGEPGKSLLLQAVRQSGELKMPPKSKLPPQAVAALEEWVKAGAPWPESTPPAAAADAWKRHWAFQPVRNPPPPATRDTTWSRTPIDRFVLARLEEKGLLPSPPADKRTLLRRVTFDLTGLPPTPEEVDAFEADHSADAYDKVVDRLLASPAYGERWGRHWLDVARYADTKGYVFFQQNHFPWAWTYRDYVIRAFNEDLPFDRFILEQLAADKLPLGRDRRPLTALGFLTVGGRFMNNPHDILDDRIDVVTRGLLGLTVGCARCHDHKFDPIPTRDYYSLYGVFASSVESDVPPLFEDPPATPEYAKFAKELAAREKALDDFVRAKQAEVVNSAKTRAGDYLLAVYHARNQPSTDEFMLLADGNDLNPTVIGRWRAYVARTKKTHDPVFAAWHRFADIPEAEFASRAAGVAAGLASGPGPVNALVARSFANRPPGSMAEVARRYGDLINACEHKWQATVDLAAAVGQPLPAALADPAEEELRQVFHAPDAAPDIPLALFNDLSLLPDRPSQAKFQELRKKVEDWRETGPAAPPRAMSLEDAATPYEPRVFVRGNPNNPGEVVPRQFLEVLAGPQRKPFTQGSGRLELAKAIASRDNPLTARVLVNRVWQHHFGQGLVRTASDFGLRSEPPSHPDLLDHLAATFVGDGWSVKRLHRRVVLSAVYRQQSVDRPEAARVDPENSLLWRMNRTRLDFEATRDALLAVSGRLDRKMGGPPVRDLAGSKATRRTVYSWIDRLQLPGLLRAFDFAGPDTSSPGRDVTTVPQQALFLMNSPFVAECARGLISRPDVAVASYQGRRVERLYRLLYGRRPTPKEVELAREFLTTNPSAETRERYAQALLLANEFVFID
jgi:hypothetical protein